MTNAIFIRTMLAAGVAMVAASFLVPFVLPARAAWTNDKAEAYNVARAELHNIAHEVGHANDPQEKQELERQLSQAQSAVDGYQKELDGAVHRADTPAWTLRVLGCLAIVLGLAGYVRGKGVFGGAMH